MKFRINERSKYNSIQTQRDGFKFASKKEAAHYDLLNIMKLGGEVLFFLRQVPFDLPGGVKYFVDFVVFYMNGEVEFVDVKGYETAEFKIKKKMVEDLYPVEIKVVK